MSADVIVVGAGAAGLVCATDLTRAGYETLVLETSDGVGGRVRSDRVDGFILDRGFQILLLAYPQVKKRLDLDALQLRRFIPGAAIRDEEGLHRVADPRRDPRDLRQTITTPVATRADKLRTLWLLADVCGHSPTTLKRRTDQTTRDRLHRAGFSEKFIAKFWRPLFAGIGLDPDLEVSARRFELILRMIALGDTALPANGIGAVTAQLASHLPDTAIRLNAPDAEVTATGVTLASGERIGAKAVVVATDGPAAHRLLSDAVPDPGSRAAACCWFALDASPLPGPWLVLDGTNQGPALNVVVMSEVQPAYAPAGKALIAAATPGPAALDQDLEAKTQEQLARWIGASTTDLRPLRTDVIPHGQPLQGPPLTIRQPVALPNGVFVCGDHRDTASLQGAMASGERTARAVTLRLAHPVTPATEASAPPEPPAPSV